MKKLIILLFAVIAGKSSFAQCGIELNIRNYSSCDAYLEVLMSAASTPSAACTSVSLTSSLITISGGATLVYNTSSLPPGITGGTYFVGAKVSTAPSGCTGSSTNIGEPCASLPASTLISTLTSICSTCGNVNVSWQPASVVGNRAFIGVRAQ